MNRIDAQYAGEKAGLRPLYEEIVTGVLAMNPDVKVVPRHEYVALQHGKTFAILMPSTPAELDIGLKLPTFDDTPRLRDSAGWGSYSVTHRVTISRPQDIDEELLDWLAAALDTVT